MAEEERILEVTPDFDGKRIDQCLAASFSDCSRSFLQKLLKTEGFDQRKNAESKQQGCRR